MVETYAREGLVIRFSNDGKEESQSIECYIELSSFGFSASIYDWGADAQEAADNARNKLKELRDLIDETLDKLEDV